MSDRNTLLLLYRSEDAPSLREADYCIIVLTSLGQPLTLPTPPGWNLISYFKNELSPLIRVL